ncbi:MAG: transcriptional repressor [Thermoplasmatales archaeon]|nr:MAG: transcriptional repressor [Thermoplasmatales archaeon]
MVEMLEKYVKLLKENSIKVTPQRLETLKYLDENRTHPTVDEIYSELKEKNPSLSKTTIYNSLETLKEHGIIQSLTISGTELRYDFENKIHHHFLCKKCGNIIDIDIECPNINKILNSGHEVEEVHGYFKGKCKKCMKKGS